MDGALNAWKRSILTTSLLLPEWALYFTGRRAQLKCRLLTGTYILQGNRAVLNQYQVGPTCRIWSVSPETRQHLVSECSFLDTERSAFIEKLLENPVLQHIPSSQLQNPELSTQLTLALL